MKVFRCPAFLRCTSCERELPSHPIASNPLIWEQAVQLAHPRTVKKSHPENK